jgi:HTH-type transcriptional regulator, transcriptional repressor of NAD biosynthesis genes
MAKAFVLLTAMPPTTGHLQLIQFANLIGEDGVEVIVCTQPHEPLTLERVKALRQAIRHQNLTKRVHVQHFSKTIEQNPKAPGFWKTWRNLMLGFGLTPNDYIVASEPYGQKLAKVTGTKFFPYDVDRSINGAKATPIRNDTLAHFDDILPEFQPYLRTTVTIFGAESTGKTTLSRELANELGGYFLFEYARPYLENTVNEITPRSMNAIWKGQVALQKQAANLLNKPFIVQDTDLFSTVGYWQFPHWQPVIGTCPEGLVQDALQLKSDLYLITKSNIPFEQDPLRYGGDVRESKDQYWIDLCERYKLNYVVLNSSDRHKRLIEAKKEILEFATKKAGRIYYDRHGL